MGRGKAPNLRVKRDRITKLPDGILFKIISMLTLKEAVRTSILSKSWRYVWNSHPDLLFDSVCILGSGEGVELSTSQPKIGTLIHGNKFVQQVDHILHQRQKGLKIDSLAICFHLGNDFASCISNWILRAITKGVDNIRLDFSQWCSSRVDIAHLDEFDLYVFPFWLLASPEKGSGVKHLQLAFCSLSFTSNSTRLTSLMTVKLQGVTITDEQLKALLSVCLLLEVLSLDFCNDLVNLKFSGSSLHLKLLTIKNCLRLEVVEVDAENLATMEYTGKLVIFSFRNVPKLAGVFLSFTGTSRVDGVNYALTRIAHHIPQLEMLNLVSVLAMKALNLPEKVPTFSNIRQLCLTVSPFQDDDRLLWVSYVLKAFPLLSELQINLFSPSYTRQSKEVERYLTGCSHRCLRKLEINGFYCNQHEIALLEFLLDNAVSLELLVISTCQKKYQGFNIWDIEEASSWYKTRIKSTIKWLHEVVSSTVQLKVVL